MHDVCELVTHQFCDKDQVLYNIGEEDDKMYIILDGVVEFSIDMEAHNPDVEDAKELGCDLGIKDLPFRLQKYRN